MPIHTSWKSMVKGMGKVYPGKKRCRKFTDSSQVCVSDKAWSVFFAKVNKMKAKSEKPMPKKVQESLEEITKWYLKNRVIHVD